MSNSKFPKVIVAVIMCCYMTPEISLGDTSAAFLLACDNTSSTLDVHIDSNLQANTHQCVEERVEEESEKFTQRKSGAINPDSMYLSLNLASTRYLMTEVFSLPLHKALHASLALSI